MTIAPGGYNPLDAYGQASPGTGSIWDMLLYGSVGAGLGRATTSINNDYVRGGTIALATPLVSQLLRGFASLFSPGQAPQQQGARTSVVSRDATAAGAASGSLSSRTTDGVPNRPDDPWGNCSQADVNRQTQEMQQQTAQGGGFLSRLWGGIKNVGSGLYNVAGGFIAQTGQSFLTMEVVDRLGGSDRLGTALAIGAGHATDNRFHDDPKYAPRGGGFPDVREAFGNNAPVVARTDYTTPVSAIHGAGWQLSVASGETGIDRGFSPQYGSALAAARYNIFGTGL